MVRASGYPVERHTARTDDGFLLTVFRIPRPGRPAVFLMHGILSSSADFVFLGKGRALALLLHDAGYDVWMGNARGTTESRRHERLRPDQAAFWDFSWHEIGTLDVPACVDLVLRRTRQSALHYVGHSQVSRHRTLIFLQ
ncbi:hypothetical protein ONE63_011394 [Megalurothrips usitatus]|uniref:Partial AB-hydrolase lipase domain-containing protein n=1 Tax=Megalurothrips usitatus TaxID=439358 RepID=A0AAV7X307_9NEOP|nr:hypothetical protein ONE63_011394 [Megalurothrips usitatus]